MAAVRGLFRWTPADGRFQRLADPEPAANIVTLCRDSRGRLWAAGDRLHRSYDSGQRWETVDLPMLCRSDTKRIRPNPERQDGLILLLRDQGVVYLDW
jgi:ligand-binding sensor domain-containing protein